MARTPRLIGVLLSCALVTACGGRRDDTGRDDTARPAPAAAPQAAAPSAEGNAPRDPASAAAARPPEPAPPATREITVPVSTPLSVRLETALASDTSTVEAPVRGTLTKPVVVDGTTVIPAGSELSGTVSDVRQSGRVKGRASVTFRFTGAVVRGETLALATAPVSRVAPVNRKQDVKKGAIGAAAGAVVGGLVGGGKGAALGTAGGATGAVLMTRGEDVKVPAGTIVHTTLQRALAVNVPRGEP